MSRMNSSMPTMPVNRVGRDGPAIARNGRALFGLTLAVLSCWGTTGCQVPLKTAVNNVLQAPNYFARKDDKAAARAREAALHPERGLPEYDAAEALYNAEKYAEAEKALKKVAKDFKDYPVEEDALFLLAECRYKQKLYTKAQDAYGTLVKKYPSTRHLEESTRRLYTIATIWLDPNGKHSAEELVQVSAEDVTDPGHSSKDVPYVFPLTPNLFDNSRPLFDTQGHALQALKSVWLNDPTGPLADDAIMMTAAHHLRRGNFREADRFFGMLREEYPKSDHAQNAFVLGSHVKLMNYQGENYDGKILNEADNLVRSTMNIYSDVPEREMMAEQLQKIQEQRAAREWARVEFYQRKQRPQSVAVYCEALIQDHPNTTYAEKARQLLADLDPKYRTGLLRTYPERTPQTPAYDEEPGRAEVSDEG